MTVSPKRISRLNVTLVSLLKRGANRQPGLLKSEDGSLQINCLSKAAPEGLLYSLVYVPNKVDAQGHFMRKADVATACHSHNRNGASLDLFHDEKPLAKEQAHVVESFVINGQDDRFPDLDRDGNKVDHDGAWGMVTKIEDPKLLAMAAAGDLSEVSLFVPAGEYELTDEPLHPQAKAETQPTMDETKLAALFATALTKAMEPVTASMDSVKEALAKKDVADSDDDKDEEYSFDPEKPPVFKGDPSCRADLVKFARQREDWVNGRKGLAAIAKGEGLEDHLKEMAKIEADRLAEDDTLGLGLFAGTSLTTSSTDSPVRKSSEGDREAALEWAKEQAKAANEKGAIS